MTTTMPIQRPPDRTLQQRLDALQTANDIRIKRAALKRKIKAGLVSPAEVLLDPPACIQSAYLLELLLAMPSIGRQKAQQMLFRHQIAPSKTVGGLTDRQRQALWADLDERYTRMATTRRAA